MDTPRSVWLIANSASGSNSEEAHAALEQALTNAGLRIAQRTFFPDDDLPVPAALDAAGVDTLVIFAGDGTINAGIENVTGWGGMILVLEGGTKNLLFHRLHGDATTELVVQRVASGNARRVRPGIIRCAAGAAYAGLMAGPGTSWNPVREALRDRDIVRLAEGAVNAVTETLEGPPIVCVEPRLGRAEGYPLLLCTPHDDAIELVAFHSDTAGEMLGQTVALAQMNFRDGPHDDLGRATRLRFESADGSPYGLLIDGEPAEADGSDEFILAQAQVDLLATVG